MPMIADAFNLQVVVHAPQFHGVGSAQEAQCETLRSLVRNFQAPRQFFDESMERPGGDFLPKSVTVEELAKLNQP